VFTRTVKGDDPVLFDVGANMGDWSAMALRICPKATIHGFELNPKLQAPLEQRFASTPSLRIHRFGLADTAREVNFFAYGGEATGLSSLRIPLHSHVPHQIERSVVRTGDKVCAELGVTKIDFLKVDVEGAEHEVLTGFSRMLQSQSISVVQFEHQHGRYLRDFYDILLPKGYALGKLYANYVDFRDHSAESEHFLGPHYIALPASRRELIALLQRGW
ncbi:MAG: FkbM family methyltransferase, partial [Verrucomicrobiaceae bacterium]